MLLSVKTVDAIIRIQILAQYVLGFTGVDHTGLYGIEAEYNTILSGQDGVINIIEDSTGTSTGINKQFKKRSDSRK